MWMNKKLPWPCNEDPTSPIKRINGKKKLSSRPAVLVKRNRGITLA